MFIVLRTVFGFKKKKKRKRKKKGRVREWRLEKEEIKGKENGERETGGVEGGVKNIL